jgi:hypothetical protein
MATARSATLSGSSGSRRPVVCQQPFGASEITVAPQVGDDRRCFRAEPSTKGIWGNRELTVVHAQPPREIEYCAELGRERLLGSLHSPFHLLIAAQRERKTIDHPGLH